MKSPVEGLEPQLFWNYFYEVTQIPRPSNQEEKIAKYVTDEAEKLGLEWEKDDTGNVIVRKAATSGLEGKKSVCIQSHLDMVCEKNSDVEFDFDNEGIRLQRDGDWLFADGTTLGADNGVGIAASLALMADKSVEHGPLEFLFTVDEETGMTGVKSLKSDFVKSRILLNMDSEEDAIFYIGCAGGLDSIVHFDLTQEDASAGTKAYEIEVKGLVGGHSGADIHLGRATAPKVLTRALIAAAGKVDLRISHIGSGNKRNAIAREGSATIHIKPDAEGDLKAICKAMQDVLRVEFCGTDPELLVVVTPADGKDSAKVMSAENQNNLLNALQALPHGVQAMSHAVPGLVETSTNLGVIAMEGKSIDITSLTRSSVDTAKEDVVNAIRSVGALAGADVRTKGGYAGWNPNPSSPTLKTAVKIWKDVFEQEAEVTAIHAGLECAIIGGLFEGMDMLSYGPTLQGVHAPTERLQISTVPRFWKFTAALLKELG